MNKKAKLGHKPLKRTNATNKRGPMQCLCKISSFQRIVLFQSDKSSKGRCQMENGETVFKSKSNIFKKGQMQMS